MGDIIQLLPDSVANQIAAGEVIQRPASVIKELIENAIDAGASQIDVFLKDAGRTLIQVIDNGKGMSCTDARMAFERHATSKIRKADDLFALHTMGFRGEALASIAAIAQVELRTRRPEDETGTYLCLSGCKVESQEAVSCPQGCNFLVKNLFFNVPARRKFLKSNQTEMNNILTEFERIALVNPQIRFSLHHNDVLVLLLDPSSVRQRIVALFGKGLNQQLLPIEVQTSLVSVSGFVGKPDSARARNPLQYFFVNGRYMRHPYFHKAVMQSYDQLIPVGKMPNYFLYLEVEPSTIDVNIHPTKTEIKFENEQPIWQIIFAAVKESLGKFNAVPSIDFDMEDAPEIPTLRKGMEVKPPQVSYNPSYNPFKSTSAPKRQHFDWAKLYEGFETNREKPERLAATAIPDSPQIQEQTEPQQMQIESVENINTGYQHLQVKGKYILTSVKSGVMLIDQHRAHVRILFDRYIKQISSRQGVPQRLLFPEIVHLPASQAVVLESIMEDISFLGFDLSDMGNFSYAVNAIPEGSEGADVNAMIQQMIETATQKGLDVKNDMHKAIALSLAESTAIPYGQVLSEADMELIIDTLFASAEPGLTPDGKPTLSLLGNEEIAKRFK